MSEIISLINEKGGVGKSTSAITISQILAISGYNILLIDLDPQMNTTKMFSNVDNIKDVNYEQIFCSKMEDKDSVLEYISPTDYNNISILSASRELNTLIYKIYDKSKEKNIELCLRNNLSLLKDEYDYIIIDNSPFKSYLTTCAICASDKIITPIGVDNFSYDGLMSLLDTIEELNTKYSLSIEFAGIFMTRVAGRTTLFKQMFEINVQGIMMSCKYFGKHMMGNGYGKIVNLSSVRGKIATKAPGNAAYCTTKGAVDMLTKQLAAELGPYGITVNAIGPTLTETPMMTSIIEQRGGDVYRKQVADGLPMRRMAVPEDCVGTAIFLSSHASDFVTGNIIYPDGGLTAIG